MSSSPDSTNVRRREDLTTEALLAAEYIEESHIQAFAGALNADDTVSLDTQGASSPNIPGTPSIGSQKRIHKVSALSDFAPVNIKVKRRKRDKSHDMRSDWLFLLLRWPLLCFILVFIAAEFGLYVAIRQLVNTKEWITAWRGKKGVLRKNLRAARTYQGSNGYSACALYIYFALQEWKEAAVILDEFLHFQEWKAVDEDPFYDWKLVKKVRRSLKRLRENNDVRGLLGVLETCIRLNFAGVESTRLYSETFLGTKSLIESYFSELERALEFLRETPELSIDEKKRFFKSANTNLGISALCLSGGASFGYYHVGVVKAFLDADLLPRVISGTSAGGLVAALVCTRTEEELSLLLVPELANRITACEEPYRVWLERLWWTGARFDSVLWAGKCTFFTRGSMTFKEAYMRTGRILNISVIPADRHSPTKLLNYMTAPDTVIWTALLASAAVPGILNPVVLLQKLKDGSVVPWNWGSKFKDGSLRVDIPLHALNLYFNVTHPIVSQVNPHVHLFFFAPRGSAGKPVAHHKGKGWRGNFLLSAAEQWLKHELYKNFKVIRDLELLPQLLGQDWSSVFLQRFDGVVTIWPRTRIWDWFRILSDPDPPELARMMRVGQAVTWPKLHMIGNRAKIEKQIFLGRQYVRRALKGLTGTELPLPPKDSAISPKRTNNPHPPSLALSPQTSSDHPMTVDTDAEAAFKRGSHWFFKRHHAGGILPSESGLDLPGADLSPPSNVHPGHNDTSTDGLLSRLRARSFPNLTLPLSGDAKRVNKDTVEHRWSSDSSSEDDLTLEDRRQLRYPSSTDLGATGDDDK